MQRSQRKLISVAILNMRFISLQRGKGRKKKRLKKFQSAYENISICHKRVLCAVWNWPRHRIYKLSWIFFTNKEGSQWKSFKVGHMYYVKIWFTLNLSFRNWSWLITKCALNLIIQTWVGNHYYCVITMSTNLLNCQFYQSQFLLARR